MVVAKPQVSDSEHPIVGCCLEGHYRTWTVDSTGLWTAWSMDWVILQTKAYYGLRIKLNGGGGGGGE